MHNNLLQSLQNGDIKSLARAISLVENASEGHLQLMKNITVPAVPVIGITGAPGTGKSTLVDAMIEEFISKNKKVGVLCVDPSSPFNMGALLGDRVRMSQWYNHPDVFIRSVASRGSLGGLNAVSIEITDLMKAAGFDIIIAETVGVGQNEVEIAGLADVTIVVLLPSSGDEIQSMKAGLMEIADIFVVNKSDLPDADTFIKNLRHIARDQKVDVIKTMAVNKIGVPELYEKIVEFLRSKKFDDKKYWLLAEKVYQLIKTKKMSGIKQEEIYNEIKLHFETAKNFNPYLFAEEYLKK